TIMQIKISGKENGKLKTIVYDLFDEYDPATKISSMARTTGYTCNAALHMIMNNIFTAKGVFPPELVGKDEECFNSILQYLKERNIEYKKTEFA
ncbi:MAG: saccharopine dehydrogenase C-terminal domain-containing protein, partial [Ginsengibacter sp.]